MGRDSRVVHFSDATDLADEVRSMTQNGPTVVEPHGESVDFGQQS